MTRGPSKGGSARGTLLGLRRLVGRRSASLGLTFPEVLFFIFGVSSILALETGKLFAGMREGPFLLWALSALLAASVLLAALSRRVGPVPLFSAVFLLAFLYAAHTNAPVRYPYGERVELEAKVLSDPRVRREALQFGARVKGFSTRGGGFVRGPGEKILLNVPQAMLAPKRGDTVRAIGLFTALPAGEGGEYARFLKTSGVTAVFEAYGRGLEVVRTPGPCSPVRIAGALKGYVRRATGRLLPWPQSEFALSLFTGNRDDLPRELVDAFVRTGTMHLLAVSGLHFGFIAMFFFFLFRLLRLNLTAIEILLIAVTLFYMVFIGDAPSVQRSAIMALCGIAVFLLDRDRNYFNILAIAFDILWCANPLAPFNPGFLLSFTATFALFFVVPPVAAFLERFMPRVLAASLAVSLGVQVYMWPVLLTYFGSFPYLNVLANIPLVPLSGAALGLELVMLFLYPVFLPLAVVVAELNTVVTTAIIRLVMVFAKVPPLELPGFPGFLVPVYFVAVTLGVHVLARRVKAKPGVSSQE